MRLFLTTLAAVIASFVVGFGVWLASVAYIPCRSESAECGAAGAYQALDVLIVAIVYVIAALRQQRQQALRRCLLTLMLFPICLLVLKVVSIAYGPLNPRYPPLLDVLVVLQGTFSFWAIVLVQWLLFRGILVAHDAREVPA